MKQARTNIPWTNLYWRTRIEIYDWGHGFVLDHRITKTMILAERWNARRYRNEAAKLSKKNTFSQRDLRRSAERLKQYSVLKQQRCCGNCHRFDNEDVCGVGWCSNNEHESSCDQVCDKHEF